MSPSEKKADLFAAINALGLPEWRASTIVEQIPAALAAYLGKAPTPIRLGLALKKLLMHKHAGLQLQGVYDSDKRMWRYRLVDTAAVPPTPMRPQVGNAPLPLAEIARWQREKAERARIAPLVVELTRPPPAVAVSVDRDGQIYREQIHTPFGEYAAEPRVLRAPERDPARPPEGKPMSQWSRSELDAEKAFLRAKHPLAVNSGAAPIHSDQWFINACRARNY
jgi:hypothetical protein